MARGEKVKLKSYQKKCLNQIKNYLVYLAEEKTKCNTDKSAGDNFPQQAWLKCQRHSKRPEKYWSKTNGLNEPLPNFCIKVPTGGGKTLLAIHTIDLVNRLYLKKRTGMVLWIVPTQQIYRQTLKNLKNREHPYRHIIDVASGGRTLILEKTDRLTREDAEENLVIMLLMLPSANRRNKETLKVFQDACGYESFFPAEDDFKAQKKLLERYQNLDHFGDKESIFVQVKTSLGNVLRILKPIVIIDEGHRAYSENAQHTIRNLNPSIVIELSATPSKKQHYRRYHGAGFRT